MDDSERSFLIRQYETAWKLAGFHLAGLSTPECLWRPAARGPHVRRGRDGSWRADWPVNEDYESGPPSIAWITWHMGFWWSMVLDHSFGPGSLRRETIGWPGTGDGVGEWLRGLEGRWRAALDGLTAAELRSSRRTHWPFRDRPFGDVVAWVNIELTKNAAEIGYARFLRAAASPAGGES
jgi:hypothetical protein